MDNFHNRTIGVLVAACTLLVAATLPIERLHAQRGGTGAATTAPAPVGPDILGLRFGMTPAQVNAVFSARFPGLRVNTESFRLPDPSKPDTYGQVLLSANVIKGAYMSAVAWERVSVDFTLPPMPQVLWQVRFEHSDGPDTGINRATLFEALRGKYGKETYATHSDEGVLPGIDSRIREMVWAWNEQGQRAPGPSGGYAFGCSYESSASTFFMNLVRGEDMGRTRSPWCTSSGIVVRAYIGAASDIIHGYETSMTNMPLALRTGEQTLAVYKATLEKWKQIELEQSKKTAPKL